MLDTIPTASGSKSTDASTRTVVVGAGLSGLATAIRLAEVGHEVLVVESHHVGGGASTRNQGWLHSGGWFARTNPRLARQCHEALARTIAFSPRSLEPGYAGMLYLVPVEDAESWTSAWGEAGIPYEPCDRTRITEWVPGLVDDSRRTAFILPDRACRFDILLGDLATLARGRGVEVRHGRTVARFRSVDGTIVGVETSDGESIDAGLVVLAGNALGMQLLKSAIAENPGQQAPCEWVALKTHLTSVGTGLASGPFCIVDDYGFHHVPRGDRGVFGLQKWVTVSDPLDERVVAAEVERIHECIARYLPGVDLANLQHSDWAGTTMQAMHDEQIVPGAAPLPTVIDHGTLSPPLHNLITIFPGRASLWDQIAEDVEQVVRRFERT